jgi:hypothetical protein
MCSVDFQFALAHVMIGDRRALTFPVRLGWSLLYRILGIGLRSPQQCQSHRSHQPKKTLCLLKPFAHLRRPLHVGPWLHLPPHNVYPLIVRCAAALICERPFVSPCPASIVVVAFDSRSRITHHITWFLPFAGSSGGRALTCQCLWAREKSNRHHRCSKHL